MYIPDGRIATKRRHRPVIRGAEMRGGGEVPVPLMPT
jgi:hypothetical protein